MKKKPGGSQLHQAVLQSVAGGWFANQHRLIFFKRLPRRAQVNEKLRGLSRVGERCLAGPTAQSLTSTGKSAWEPKGTGC